MKKRTPSIDKRIIRYLQYNISDKINPIIVPVNPNNIPNAGKCWDNVDKKVKEFGGSKIYGWKLTIWPGVELYGEFHAIWNTHNSQYIDVACDYTIIKNIMFQTDPERGKILLKTKIVPFPLQFAIFKHKLVDKLHSKRIEFEKLRDILRKKYADNNVNKKDPMHIEWNSLFREIKKIKIDIDCLIKN